MRLTPGFAPRRYGYANRVGADEYRLVSLAGGPDCESLQVRAAGEDADNHVAGCLGEHLQAAVLLKR